MEFQKELVFDDAMRARMTAGVVKIAKAVKSTLGPSGRVAILGREFSDPIITKDGVTVARSISLKDGLEDMAARVIRQAAIRTAQQAGDGTTTATLYAESIYLKGLKVIAAGSEPQAVKRGIEKAVKAVVDYYAKVSLPVMDDIEKIKNVATCSANQDANIGAMIARAMELVGIGGVITIENGKMLDTTISTVNGIRLNSGYQNPYFSTNEQLLITEFENPYILITDQNITSKDQIIKAMGTAVNDKRPLVVIASNIDGEALRFMVLQHVNGVLKSVAIKSPGFGDRQSDTLSDIAVAVGAKFFSAGGGTPLPTGNTPFNPKDFGTCDKITVSRDFTTILGGAGDQATIDTRIDSIKAQLEVTITEFDIEKLQERLARLTGSIAQIAVGGATDVEVREKRDRVEDALHASKAAVDEGIMAGGGIAPLRARESLDVLFANAESDDEKAGIRVIRETLEEPIRQLSRNAGIDPGKIFYEVDRCTDVNTGFNFASREICDMLTSGVIVPTKVERVALQNAASAASLLLITDCAVVPIMNDRTDIE